MDDNTPLSQNVEPNVFLTPQKNPSNSRFHLVILLTLGFVIIAMTSAAIGYFVGATRLQVEEPSSKLSPTIVEDYQVPELEVSPTDTPQWITYSQPEMPFTFVYPDQWNVEVKMPSSGSYRIAISHLQHEIGIDLPQDFGPGGFCFYPDSTEYETYDYVENPMGYRCDWSYAEVISPSGSVRRRKEYPSEDDLDMIDSSRYLLPVLTRMAHEEAFSGVPPISYSVPLDYDPEQLLIMDKILSTFRMINV